MEIVIHYVYKDVLLSVVWMSVRLVKTFVKCKNLQYCEITSYGYSKCHFHSTLSLGRQIDKLMYNNQNPTVSAVLQVFKLNSIEQACIWKAV